jgi:hypothetical protein
MPQPTCPWLAALRHHDPHPLAACSQLIAQDTVFGERASEITFSSANDYIKNVVFCIAFTAAHLEPNVHRQKTPDPYHDSWRREQVGRVACIVYNASFNCPNGPLMHAWPKRRQSARLTPSPEAIDLSLG